MGRAAAGRDQQGDVLELVSHKAAMRKRKRKRVSGGAAVQVGKMLTRLRTFFGWAVANDLAPADPTVGRQTKRSATAYSTMTSWRRSGSRQVGSATRSGRCSGRC